MGVLLAVLVVWCVPSVVVAQSSRPILRCVGAVVGPMMSESPSSVGMALAWIAAVQKAAPDVVVPAQLSALSADAPATVCIVAAGGSATNGLGWRRIGRWW